VEVQQNALNSSFIKYAVVGGLTAVLGTASMSLAWSYPASTIGLVALCALCGNQLLSNLKGEESLNKISAAEYLKSVHHSNVKNLTIKLRRCLLELHGNVINESVTIAKNSGSSHLLSLLKEEKMSPLDAWLMIITDEDAKGLLTSMKRSLLPVVKSNFEYFMDAFSKNLNDFYDSQNAEEAAFNNFEMIIDILQRANVNFKNVFTDENEKIMQPQSPEEWNWLLNDTLNNGYYAITINESMVSEIINVAHSSLSSMIGK
jgi:hypothetical protein